MIAVQRSRYSSMGWFALSDDMPGYDGLLKVNGPTRDKALEEMYRRLADAGVDIDDVLVVDKPDPDPPAPTRYRDPRPQVGRAQLQRLADEVNQ